MPFPKELLTADEEVVLDLRPHWWFIAPASVYLAAAVVVGIVLLARGPEGTAGDILRFLVGIGVLVALGYFAIRYARWASTNFVITNERIVSRSGVVAKRGMEIPLDRVNTVFFSQSVFERILGAGDLGIESAGEQGRQNFTDIRKPSLVQQEVYRQKENFEKGQHRSMGASIAAAMPMGGAGGPSIPDQIEQLDRLRRNGVLTEEEFQAKKAELLRRL